MMKDGLKGDVDILRKNSKDSGSGVLRRMVKAVKTSAEMMVATE